MKALLPLLAVLLAACVVVQPVPLPFPAASVCDDPGAGAAYGAAIGAGMGAIAGSMQAEAGHGALVGAGVGALAGAAMGSVPCENPK